MLGAVALALLLVAARSTLVVAALIVAGFLRIGLSGLQEILGGQALQTAAGLSGLLLGAVAAYRAVAFLLEDRQRRELVPVGRHGPAAESLQAGLSSQLDRLENEPGVRKQL